MAHRVSKASLDHIKAVWKEWQQGNSPIDKIEDYIRGYVAGKDIAKEEQSHAYDYIMIELEVWEAEWESQEE